MNDHQTIRKKVNGEMEVFVDHSFKYRKLKLHVNDYDNETTRIIKGLFSSWILTTNQTWLLTLAILHCMSRKFRQRNHYMLN